MACQSILEEVKKLTEVDQNNEITMNLSKPKLDYGCHLFESGLFQIKNRLNTMFPSPATLPPNTVPPLYVSSRTTPPPPPTLVTVPPLSVSSRTTPPPTEGKKEEKTSSVVPTTLTATPPNDEEETKELTYVAKTSTAPTTECSNGSGNTEEKDPKRLKINNLPLKESPLEYITSSNHKRGRGGPKKRTRASMEEELE